MEWRSFSSWIFDHSNAWKRWLCTNYWYQYQAFHFNKRPGRNYSCELKHTVCTPFFDWKITSIYLFEVHFYKKNIRLRKNNFHSSNLKYSFFFTDDERSRPMYSFLLIHWEKIFKLYDSIILTSQSEKPGPISSSEGKRRKGLRRQKMYKSRLSYILLSGEKTLEMCKRVYPAYLSTFGQHAHGTASSWLPYLPPADALCLTRTGTANAEGPSVEGLSTCTLTKACVGHSCGSTRRRRESQEGGRISVWWGRVFSVCFFLFLNLATLSNFLLPKHVAVG